MYDSKSYEIKSGFIPDFVFAAHETNNCNRFELAKERMQFHGKGRETLP
jgi:hypothetical protein